MTRGLMLLGAPRADAGGMVEDLPLDKPASLLYYLARRDDWVSRSELAFLYRPNAPEHLALANVRVYLHRAKVRPWAERLEVEKFRVRYPVETDVSAFLSALKQQFWQAALELYRGPFLSGIHLADTPGYETWLELERQDLSRKWRTAALHHAHELETQQDIAGAQHWLERILTADPLDEEALQGYLRMLFLVGKRRQALDAYEHFQDELERELDIEPLEATRALLESLSREETTVQGSLVHRTPDARPQVKHNLPAQTTRFIGRGRELVQLADILAQPDCRLLTLVGLGGVGKTRLALELASGKLETYADGVWFVPLAGVGSPDLLVSSLAGAVGFTFSGPSDPQAQLKNFLREKDLLLLLDNFEHLVEGAVLLEELLETAPGLKLLVTSRVALELTGEWLFDLTGLVYPATNTEEPLNSFDAVRLFNNRAERLSSLFVAEGKTLEAVAELTRKVEGLPLALELAASWTRSLGVPQLLTELDKNFDVLSGHLRDLPERHRCVRTVFEYSWQRLSEKEQEALAKLSLFQGGFTLEAAEQVADVHLALLLSLINHSLVRRSQEGRYQLHELVRQYALSQLDESLKTKLDTDFSRYYLGLLARCEPGLRGAQQNEIKHMLLKDADNLRSAWATAVRKRSWETVDASIKGLHRLWLRANFFQEGCTVFARLVDSLSADNPQTERLLARARVRLGFYQRNLGSFQDARTSFAEASMILRRLDIKDELAFALHELGHVARKMGDLVGAELYLQESLEVCKDVDDDALYADTLFHLALLRRDQGQFAEAKACLESCVKLGTRLSDVSHLATVRAQLGVLILQSGGNSSEAKRYIEQSLEIFNHLDDKDEASLSMYNLGRLAYEEGDFQQSEEILLECLRLRRHLGSPYVQESVLGTLGEMSRDQGRYAEARDFFEQSLELSYRLDSPVGQAYSLSDLADISRRLGDVATARHYFGEALKLLISAGIPKIVSIEILYFAALFSQSDSPLEACLLVSCLARQEGLSHHLRERIELLSEQLASRLSPRKVARLDLEATPSTLEAMLEKQLALLENPAS